jgi:hypothetical protein
MIEKLSLTSSFEVNATITLIKPVIEKNTVKPILKLFASLLSNKP